MLRLPYPKSFIKLIFLGFSLILLPMLAALIYAAVYIDRLSDQSKNAVYNAVTATQSGRKLAEEIVIMERYAKQYQILKDSALLKSYRETHFKFLQTASILFDLKPDILISEELTELLNKELKIFNIFNDINTSNNNREAAVLNFIELSNMSRNILTGSNRLINHEVSVLQNISANAKTIFMWLSLCLVPMVGFIAAGFVILITKPIKQIEHAIIQLGMGKFSDSIRVSGPQDMEYLGQRLDWLRLRFAEVEADKVKFISHISHELKTPLASIYEGTALLADEVVGSLQAEQRGVVKILKTNNETLRKLIDDLVNFNISHHKSPVLVNESIKLDQVMEQVISNQNLQIKAKEIKIKKDLAPLSVLGDREKIRIMFDNLLSNGVKYSPCQGVIEINIKKMHDWAMVEISDEGPGIAEDEKNRIFDPFYQGRILADGHIKGTGLGLAITKEYVEIHGGKVKVIDNEKYGAHLCLQIPVEEQKKSL